MITVREGDFYKNRHPTVLFKIKEDFSSLIQGSRNDE